MGLLYFFCTGPVRPAQPHPRQSSDLLCKARTWSGVFILVFCYADVEMYDVLGVRFLENHQTKIQDDPPPSNTALTSLARDDGL